MSANTVMTASIPQERIAGPMAERLVAHLRDEESSLARLLGAVRKVHSALRELNDDALSHALEEESQELVASASMQQRRHQLRADFGTVLGIPKDQVTLRQLVACTSGLCREGMESLRMSLVEMSAEMDRLNRQNAAMIRQSLAIARGIVERLTGTVAAGESYNADGVREEARVGSLVQWGA